MQSCNKNIIECLREANINPVATSRTQYSSTYSTPKAIDYTTTTWYESNDESSSQWWKIDFQQPVTLDSYRITVAGTGCYWLKKWKASISNDDSSWEDIGTEEDSWSGEKMINISKPVNARYFKIDSLNGKCGYRIAIRYIKFFGSLSNKKTKNLCTCKRKRGLNLDILRYILLLCS